MAVNKYRFPAPGKYGIAKDLELVPLGPDWCFKATNMVADDSGLLGARFGKTQTHAGSIDGSASVEQIFEYLAKDGTSRTVFATATKLWEDEVTPTNRTGTVTATAGNWKFVNFNGKVLGWQAGHTPIVKTGAGNFAHISVSDGGTLPDGNTALAAFGRVWAVDDDKQTIRYSALLDETKWAVASGAGSIDMSSVWSQGIDEVIELVAYGSNFVVFGKRHIVIWTDGSGSQLGIDPDNMYVTDSIEGTGAVIRDTVTLAGEIDVVFMSPTGFRSLSRTIQERASSATNLSPSNQKHLQFVISQQSVPTRFRLVYDATRNWVIFSAGSPWGLYVLDLRQRTPDNGFRLTDWTSSVSTVAVLLDGTILFGTASLIGKYLGDEDFGFVYDTTFETSWIDLGGEAQSIQALKGLNFSLITSDTQTVGIKWFVDFNDDAVNELDTINLTIGASGDPLVYSSPVPLYGKGQFIKLHILVDNVSVVAGNPSASMQLISLFTKPIRFGYGF